MNLEALLKDYSDVDSATSLLISNNEIKEIITESSLSERTKTILNNLYDDINYLYKYSFLLLEKHPCEIYDQIDLTIFEGSGFYQFVSPHWIYHKGAGSIEALTIQKKLNFSAEFPAFGMEYPGYCGTFSSSSILGVKRLWQCVHEFAVSFTLLCHTIENNNEIDDYKKLFGRLVIPLGVVSMPRLSNVISDNLYSKPESIKNSYNDVSSVNQAAKILMLVPSPIRGTDNYDIEGKWVETHNIFIRTTSSYKTNLHSYSESPFWSEIQTKIRARTIRVMFEAGFIFQPISSHLQNYYVIPDDIKENFSLNAADYCDFLPLANISNSLTQTIFGNIINGWRIAESSGPMYTSYNSSVSLFKIQELADVFFKELLQDNYNSDMGKLFMILPFSTAVAITKIFCKTSKKNLSISNWQKILEATGYKGEIDKKINTIIEKYNKESPILYEQLEDLRPKQLVEDLIKNFDDYGVENIKFISLIFDQIMALPSSDDYKKAIMYYCNIAIENAYLLEEDLRKLTSNICDNLYSILEIESLSLSLLERYSKTLKTTKLRKFIKDSLEETLHAKHHDIRNLILVAKNDFYIKKWVEKFTENSKPFLQGSLIFSDDYLGFIFKRDQILSKIKLSNSAEEIKSKIFFDWSGDQRPVYRPYPDVRIIEDCSDDDLIKFFINFIKFINRAGIIL